MQSKNEVRYVTYMHNAACFLYRVRSDHNEDRTLEILKIWLSSVEGHYHSINAELLSSPPVRLPEEKGPAHWPSSRFTHVIQLREEALAAARHMWADYILVSVQ